MGNRATNGRLKYVLTDRMSLRDTGEDEGKGRGDVKGTECIEGGWLR